MGSGIAPNLPLPRGWRSLLLRLSTRRLTWICPASAVRRCDRHALLRFRIIQSAGIPVTYVPARNTVFLASPLAGLKYWLAPAIFHGVNAVDYSGYPDCRPEFIAAFERVAKLGTRAGIEGKPSSHAGTAYEALQGRHHPPRHALGLRVEFSLYGIMLCGRFMGSDGRRRTCDSCRCGGRAFAMPVSRTPLSTAKMSCMVVFQRHFRYHAPPFASKY